MLTRVRVGWMAVVGLAAALTPLAAHHGTAASYDQTKTTAVKGIVTEFLWRNPHCALFLDVKQPDGKVVGYSVEMYSPSLMVKQGYTRTVLKKGDAVDIDVHPSLAGTPSGECLGCKLLVNGKNPAEGQAKGKGRGKQ
ncbi:MAG: DUF6152 family protein [Acidobacteriota bacterium]